MRDSRRCPRSGWTLSGSVGSRRTSEPPTRGARDPPRPGGAAPRRRPSPAGRCPSDVDTFCCHRRGRPTTIAEACMGQVIQSKRVEPPTGFEHMTYALRGRRAAAPSAPPAPTTRLTAPMALPALGERGSSYQKSCQRAASRYGSAIGLRNTPWYAAPATASTAPTSTASTTRGARTCQRIVWSTVLSGSGRVQGGETREDRARDCFPAAQSSPPPHRGHCLAGRGPRSCASAAERLDLVGDLLHELHHPWSPLRRDLVLHRDDGAVLHRQDGLPGLSG
jgi:hypothetical protein